jgi:hypothetical protein
MECRRAAVISFVARRLATASPDNATARVWTHHRGVEAAAGDEAFRSAEGARLPQRMHRASVWYSRSRVIEGKRGET